MSDRLNISGKQVLDMPYTFIINSSGASGTWLVQDTDKKYFNNNKCVSPGLYIFTVMIYGNNGQGSPSYISANINGFVNTSLGYFGVVNANNCYSIPIWCNENFTISASWTSASLTISANSARLIITKIL